jgi:DNA-binding LacI/PurR family transcriptional regulator
MSIYWNNTQACSLRAEWKVSSQSTPVHSPAVLPTVAVAGHTRTKGVTNIILDHHVAGQLVISHVIELGPGDCIYMQAET